MPDLLRKVNTKDAHLFIKKRHPTKAVYTQIIFDGYYNYSILFDLRRFTL
jgi:hypothetical protein